MSIFTHAQTARLHYACAQKEMDFCNTAVLSHLMIVLAIYTHIGQKIHGKMSVIQNADKCSDVIMM